MSDSYPFMILEQPCNEAIAWIVHQVSEAGLQVIRTFDLRDARHDPVDCPCPHHGTDQCDCQMVVMLIYGEDNQPVSLVAHSYEGATWFSLVDTPQQRADSRLERTIRLALSSQSIPPLNQTVYSYNWSPEPNAP